MSNRAARRIKKKESTGGKGDKGGEGSTFYVFEPGGPLDRFRLPVIVVISVAIHAVALLLFNFFPEFFPAPMEEAVIYSVEIASLPGPMGGGGESSKPEEPKKKPEPEPEPEPEPVVAAPEPEPVKPEPEPVKPEPAKPTEKPESAKPKPEAAAKKPAETAPKGPGVGPVGGGKEGAEGPVTVSGGIPFPFPEYLKQVEIKTKTTWGRSRTNYRTRVDLLVEVSFSIDRHGRVKDARVTKSSKNSLVDRFALGVVKDSSPYNRLPDGYGGNALGIVYRFTIPPN